MERKYLNAVRKQVLENKPRSRNYNLDAYSIKEFDQDITIVGPVNKKYKKALPYKTSSTQKKKRRDVLQRYGARAGFNVGSGDFNGDGIDDIVISAPFVDSPTVAGKKAGAIYILYGNERSEMIYDLEFEADVTLLGSNPSDRGSITGHAFTTGDLNGDGIDDLIVGAPLSRGINNLEYAGAVYVLYGGKDLEGIHYLKQKANAVFYGKQKFDRVGYAMSVCDHNGDGMDDLIIAAPGVKAEEANTLTNGELYVILSSGQFQGEYVAYDVADAIYGNLRSVITSYSQEDISSFLGLGFMTMGTNFSVGLDISANRYGTALTNGDFNGDGIADIAVGSPYTESLDGKTSYVGSVNIIYGSLKSHERRNMDIKKDSDVTLFGDYEKSFMGYSLSSGDFNGDGYDELFIGMPNYVDFSIAPFNIGKVYVLEGQSEFKRYLTPSKDIDLSIKGALLGKLRTGTGNKIYGDVMEAFNLGDRRDAYFGYSITSGDFNGDARDDILIGAPGYSTKKGVPIISGSAFVFFGQDIKKEERNATNADIKIMGKKRDGRTGFSVNYGDFNGDNIDDMLIGSPDSNSPNFKRMDAGEVYVIYGHFHRTGTR